MNEKKGKVILITGMPGAGKEEFIKICKKRGLRILRMGDLVRAEAREISLDLTDINVGNLAQKMREEHGYDVWARKTMDEIDERPTVVDGLRGPDELILFRKELGDSMAVIALIASPEVRFERLKARNRADAPSRFSDFEEREGRESAWGLGEVIASAEYLIVNESTPEELEKRAEAVMDEILGQQ